MDISFSFLEGERYCDIELKSIYCSNLSSFCRSKLMEWIKKFGRKKKNGEPAPQPVERPSQLEGELEDPAMEKLLDLFMRTCWSSFSIVRRLLSSARPSPLLGVQQLNAKGIIVVEEPWLSILG
jgi:hypothetical protein